MSKFSILWIDDQPDKIGLELENVRKILEDKNYEPSIELIKNFSKSDLDDNSLFLNRIKSREFDLLFIDYKLSNKVLGSNIVSKIRQDNNIYVDIIFYSSDKDDLIEQIIKSYKGSILNYLDDVHILPLDDTDFYEKVEQIICKIIGSWYNAHSVRGIVLSKSSKIEQMIVDIIRNVYLPHKGELKTKLEEKKANIEKSFSDKWKAALKEDDSVKHILDRPINFGWNIKKLLLGCLCDLKVLYIDEKILEDIEDIFSVRNDMAHNRARIENGVLKLLKNGKEETYDENAITELIQRINNVDETLFSMLND